MIEWQDPAEAVTGEAARAPFCRALLCDLRDPRLLPFLRPAPNAQDHADERRPAASDRAYFLARRVALRSLVGRAAGVPGDAVVVAYDAAGAPRVRSHAGLFVSVAGRGAIAALAVASHPVGIDLEPDDPAAEPIDAVLHAQERAALAGLASDARGGAFLRLWTAKEAYLKALGAGLVRDPAEVAATFGDALTLMDRDAPAPVRSAAFSPARAGLPPLVAACVVLRG